MRAALAVESTQMVEGEMNSKERAKHNKIKKTELFKLFKQFADQNGINTNDPEDWYPWYACWIDGFAVGKSDEF